MTNHTPEEPTNTPVVVDDRLYRIQSNGHFAEDDVQVLEK